MSAFRHQYNYDPSYGFSFEELLRIPPPQQEPSGFEQFWRQKYLNAVGQSPSLSLHYQYSRSGYKVYDASFQSTNDFKIAGWLLEPEDQPFTQGIVVGHGYGGREHPDYHINIPGALLFFPCFRGISRSRCQRLPESPNQHVLQGVDDPNHYVIGGCVEDLWLAVTALTNRYPVIAERISYMGISFGGGVGALAAPWDIRLKRIHLNVPTFGNQPLRLALPTSGSAAALKQHSEFHDHVFATLAYYDAALAARYAWQPLHLAAALFDPVVAPPGQFAIFNAWSAEKRLFVLEAGHFEYSNQFQQEQQLISELRDFLGASA